jgi:hypothetical protein
MEAATGRYWTTIFCRCAFTKRYTDGCPIPLLTSPLKGEERGDFPPLQGEGQGGGGVKYATEFMKYSAKRLNFLQSAHACGPEGFSMMQNVLSQLPGGRGVQESF